MPPSKIWTMFSCSARLAAEASFEEALLHPALRRELRLEDFDGALSALDGGVLGLVHGTEKPSPKRRLRRQFPKVWPTRDCISIWISYQNQAGRRQTTRPRWSPSRCSRIDEAHLSEGPQQGRGVRAVVLRVVHQTAPERVTDEGGIRLFQAELPPGAQHAIGLAQGVSPVWRVVNDAKADHRIVARDGDGICAMSARKTCSGSRALWARAWARRSSRRSTSKPSTRWAPTVRSSISAPAPSPQPGSRTCFPASSAPSLANVDSVTVRCSQRRSGLRIRKVSNPVIRRNRPSVF